MTYREAVERTIARDAERAIRDERRVRVAATPAAVFAARPDGMHFELAQIP